MFHRRCGRHRTRDCDPEEYTRQSQTGHPPARTYRVRAGHPGETRNRPRCPRRYGPRRSQSRTACAAWAGRQRPQGTPRVPRSPCIRTLRPARDGSYRARYTCSSRPSSRHLPRFSYSTLPTQNAPFEMDTQMGR